MKEKLEGREVKFVNNCQQEFHCLVTGFDYWLGVTLQEKDTNTYIYCMLSYFTATKKGYCPTSQYTAAYPKIFGYIKRCIQNKEPVYADKVAILLGQLLPSDRSDEYCAFT